MATPPITVIGESPCHQKTQSKYGIYPSTRRKLLLDLWVIGGPVKNNPGLVFYQDVLETKIPFLRPYDYSYRISLENLQVLFRKPIDFVKPRDSKFDHLTLAQSLKLTTDDSLDYSDFPQEIVLTATEPLTFVDFLEEINQELKRYAATHPQKKIYYDENRLHHHKLEDIYHYGDNVYHVHLSDQIKFHNKLHRVKTSLQISS